MIFSINATSASYHPHSTTAVGGSGIDDQSRELGFGWTDTRFNRELFAYVTPFPHCIIVTLCQVLPPAAQGGSSPRRPQPSSRLRQL
jgi:hypothetical protein